ncbi:hypothetical protein DIPPA_25542 [Diplonema papillatum]|nr:hypothetical protein DIPPA_25542 [Diplonema papillatum]
MPQANVKAEIEEVVVLEQDDSDHISDMVQERDGQHHSLQDLSRRKHSAKTPSALPVADRLGELVFSASANAPRRATP